MLLKLLQMSCLRFNIFILGRRNNIYWMGFKAYINVLYCLGIETQVEFGKETIG